MTAQFNRFARLLVSVLFFLLSVAARALDANLPPGGNFDLTHWKLQLPTDGGALTCTNFGADEVTPAQLEAGFTNAYFYTGSDGAMVFWAPVNGARTSGSDNPRSELRELIKPSGSGNSGVNWILYGTHILDAQCKVLQVANPNKQVIIGQIHGENGAALPTVKLYYNNNGTLSANIKTNATCSSCNDFKFTDYGTVGLSNLITYQIKAVNGVITIAMNNKTNSINIFQYDSAFTNATQYFKAGNYNQEPSCSNPQTNLGSRVSFYALTLFHAPSITNQPVSQTVAVGSNVTFAVGAAGNPPLNYFWQLNGTNLTGKTNATLSIPNVQLTNAGNYSVIVTDAVGTVASVVTSSVATLTVLSANFTATPTNGVAPLQVVFTDVSAGPPTNWNWDFDNNGSTDSTAKNPTNTYASPGTYTVRLIASIGGVSSTNTKSAYINILPSPPTANFTAAPTNGVEPLNVTFTDTSIGSPTGWEWTFGDTGTSALQSPSHSYSTAGVYTVRLIASNGGGSSTNTKTAYINVITALQSWSNYYGVPIDLADADGDGLSNTNEFLAGFNPTNNAAYLQIIGVAQSGDDVNIAYLGANGDNTWSPGIAARTNVLEYSTGTADGGYTNNFVSTGQTNVLDGGNGSGVVTNMADPGGATNVPSRFYRMRVLVP